MRMGVRVSDVLAPVHMLPSGEGTFGAEGLQCAGRLW
jgi:hypothetical protein